ncbi:AbrB/MazE/SpoVT family DNA-binding domain-containing protein [Candidatus Woesearchaeota archaeon]|mgnify:FL=1|jgi:AbrB family looped-hinge helix DNA binding protein|nr:AbrB/MazE/SpoVT family DNA-binding domain-containing protein [Candidatus Woesearchaeota archaeon]MBT7062386.1 AbrB/MazE/SpoVT family DNA-binding domain-containing protein [Candidatus Woesearchaeota archaeon]MBT7402175.1 AbrB/MazE/SpoVT family DNA-binding domain-containing protein [Candidatus Woesearchaeota archaeon]
MKIKTVTVSEKGQIALPVDFRNIIGIEKGSELIILQQGQELIIKKVEAFADLLKNAESTAKQLWDNKYDEIWNDI